MLVKNQKIKMNWNGAHKKYYEEKGYPFTNYGDEFEVKIEDLALKSQKYILIRCDYCGIPFLRKYSNHNIRKEKYGMDDKDCCDDCRVYKREETMIDKYGVDNPFKSEEIKDKIKEIIKEKYGVEDISQSEEIKEKKKQTCLDKYGVEYTLQVPEIREKITETNIEKYGAENPFQVEEIKEKIKQVNMDKCGVKYASQSLEVKEKTKQTNLIRYGKEHYSQTDECKEKIKQTNLDKYGVEYYTQTDEYKEKYKNTCQEKYGVDNVSQVPEIAEKISQSRSKEFKDLTNMKFNHLTVISLLPDKTNKHGDRYWLCECDCEDKTKKEIAENHLVRGNIKSCGCILKESLIERWEGKTKKDLYPYYKEIYSTYDSMRKRCYNEKHDNYKRYGGRGIVICDEWLNNFMNFYNWAIENDYKENLTIERIDYDGNYEPSNCKWATWEEQSYNKSNTLYIEVDNEMKTVKQWSDETGIPSYIIYQRYTRYKRKDRQELELLTKEKFFKPVRLTKRSKNITKN